MPFVRRRRLLTAVLLSAFSLNVPLENLEARPQDPPVPAPGGALGELDELFLNSYRARREAIKQETSPVIVVSGSSLILFRAGQRESVRVIPNIYHALKAVAHLPFALYLRLLAPAANGTELTQDLLTELELFDRRIAAAQSALATSGFTPEQLERQTKILTESKAIVTETLKEKRISMSKLIVYAKRLGPFMLANADDAGCSQIRETHLQVMKWKQMMGPEEWNALLVVNRAKHQSRYRSAATQYFAWLIVERTPSWSYPGEGMRVVFAEFLGDKEDSRDLLATVLIDADASATFFGDAWRLSEDILSQGAGKCLKELPRI